jgi:hypothetical protein
MEIQFFPLLDKIHDPEKLEERENSWISDLGPEINEIWN